MNESFDGRRKFSVNRAVIVEGKYDKIKLSDVIDGVIISTDGFGVFKNKEKLELIRYYSERTGIIILTDSDTAGFKIRNFLKGAVRGDIINVYIPDIFGKERRKVSPSKEGKLGVEGIDADRLIESFKKAGVVFSERNTSADLAPTNLVTRADFYDLGLSGGKDSSSKRRELLSKLELPQLLTTTGIIEIINTMMTRDEFYNMLNSR